MRDPRSGLTADRTAVCWATDYQAEGNAYGYSVHNAESRRALETAGVAMDPSAPIALHVAPAHLFRPMPGKVNVLYMAWETAELPTAHREGIARADAVVVTASFLKDVVTRAFPDKPVYLCHEGVDVECFAFKRRARPAGKPFRFLWVGAPNARKGWELVIRAWAPFIDTGRAELYLKTTVTNRFERHRNVTFDSRNLSRNEMVALYHSAHAFVFPTFGEGFGLTMAEAMATGLPVLYTPWSSLTDLADARCGYPLLYRMVDAWATPDGGLSTDTLRPHPAAVRTQIAQADTDHLAARMVHVFRHYSQAVRRGIRAAERIRSRFTWARTGARLATIVQEVNTRCLPARFSVRATV